MAKTKKAKRHETESEDSSSNSESSDSDSSNSSTSSEEKMKRSKSNKKHRKRSTSSSSSNSDSNRKMLKRKRKNIDTKNEKQKNYSPSRVEHKPRIREEFHKRDDDFYGHRQQHNHYDNYTNRSKWDSPSRQEPSGNNFHYNDRRNRHDDQFWRNDNQRNFGRGIGGAGSDNKQRYYDRNNDNRNYRNNQWNNNRQYQQGGNNFNREYQRSSPDRRQNYGNNFRENRHGGDNSGDQLDRRNTRYDQHRSRPTERDNIHDERRENQNRSNDSKDNERRNQRERSWDRGKRIGRSPRHSKSPRRSRNDKNDGEYEWGGGNRHKKENNSKSPGPSIEKEKPNFGLSGKLTEDTNTVNGVVIKYSEPLEARKPRRRWRLYPFKGEKAMPTLYIHRQSCFLVGRDRKVCDLPVDHPSCSKQHAVIQYRLVPFERDNGTIGKRVRPYVIDLESANGTFLNNKRIESKKYIELIEKDVIKFGFSSREYVLLHENSKEDELDDDVLNDDEQNVPTTATIKQEPSG